jgi:malonyl-CoA O-methyltransferase
MPAPALDHLQVRRAFARAAPHYAQFAVLQREVERRLLEQLDAMPHAPERILDLGCGPGTASLALKQRWPRAQVIALDSALPMLHMARKTAGRWRPRFSCVAGDARALPFAPHSFDLVFSSLCMPWQEDMTRLALQWRTVLKPDGVLLASGLGPATLQELAQTFADVDPERAHVHGFASSQLLGDTLLAAGFRNPVVMSERFTLTYPNLAQLLLELRATGSTNALQQRRRSLTGKGRFAAATRLYETFRAGDGLLPATVEVTYMQALGYKPRPRD